MQAEISPPPLTARKPRRRPLISLTPLIDVVFILLIFFMLTTSLTQWRTIDLPSASSSASSASSESDDVNLLLDVLSDGELRLDGKAIDPVNLIDDLQKALAERDGTKIFVRPHAGVDLQRTVTVLDRMADAGIGDVSLVRAAK